MQTQTESLHVTLSPLAIYPSIKVHISKAIKKTGYASS